MSTTTDTESSAGNAFAEPATGNRFSVDVWVTLKRWLRKTLRNPFVVVGALLTPFILLVLFTELFGQITEAALSEALGSNVSYIIYIVPAVAILSAMDAAANSGMGLVNDMESGMFEKVLVSPTHRSAIFLGKTLSDIVQVIVQTGLILVIGYAVLWVDTGGSPGVYVQTGLFGVVGIFAVVLVFSLWFAAFSNVAALVTQDTESTAVWTNLLQFPLLFVSSAFLPVSVLPEWMQVVATVNPITYGVDAVRALMLGRDVLAVIEVSAFSGIWKTLVPAIAVLGVLDLVLGVVAVFFLHRMSSSTVH